MASDPRRGRSPSQQSLPHQVAAMIDAASSEQNPRILVQVSQARASSVPSDLETDDTEVDISGMGGSRFGVFPNITQTLADLLDWMDANWPSGGGGGGSTFYKFGANDTTNYGVGVLELVDGARTTWTLDHTPAANSLTVTRNGVTLEENVGYLLVVNVITILDSPAALVSPEHLFGGYTV